MPLNIDDIAASERDGPDLRLLMEQQLDRIDALAESGLETEVAQVLLRRLMDRDKDQRFRMLLGETDRLVAA